MLYEHNTHAKYFQMGKQMINEGNIHNLKLHVISDRTTDGMIYNHLTILEVIALIVNDVDMTEKIDTLSIPKYKRKNQNHTY